MAKKDTNIAEAGNQEGHNVAGQFSVERLSKFIERVEKREEDKRMCSTDIRTIYQEAEAAGLNSKVIRQIVAERRKDKDTVAEQEELKRIYKEALGEYSSTPLGSKAVEKAA